MPKLDVYCLTFRDGLHVGYHGIGQENVLAHIPSDTLFAALAAARERWRGDAGSWTDLFCTSTPPLRLTSAFPFAGGVLFYPRLLNKPGWADPKVWRRLRYVSENVLRQLLKSDTHGDFLPLQNGALWLTAEEKKKLPNSLIEQRKGGADIRANQKVWYERTVPRVTVDRITNRSEIFHTGQVRFLEGCGLWFGTQWQDEGQRPELEETLSMLGDMGLGAERSVGYGAFQFERLQEQVSWDDPRPEGLMFLLSRYSPADVEDARSLQQGAAYDLVHVAGYVQTAGVANQRRRGANLVVEGSLVGGAARGRLVDVQPTVQPFPHAVYRYGLALGIGVEASHE